MFEGANALSLDIKGRMAIPTSYRAIIQGYCEGNLFLTMDIKDPCLLLYTQPEWEFTKEKINKLPSRNGYTRMLVRILVGQAAKCKLDGNGRILIPPLLREQVGIDKSIVLTGAINKFEIWDEQKWKDEQASMRNGEVEALPDEHASFNY